MNSTHVGVIGLGGMGKALSESLIAAEHPLAVWDRHTSRVATTAMIGAAPTTSPQQLAELSDVIFLALPNPAAVREVLFAEDTGVLAGIRESALIVDMSTGDPTLAEDVAQHIKAQGINARYIDAPVSGKAPRLTVMVGGAPGDLGAAEAIVNDISSNIIYAGSLGDGFAVKLIHQHIKYATHLAVAEAMIIAESAGLDTDTVIDALNSSSGVAGGMSGVVEYYKQDNRAIRAHAPVTTIAKDMRLATNFSVAHGVNSATLAAAHEFFATAAESPLAARPYPESTELLKELRTAGRVN